jgi:hypothetical protein
MFLLNEGDALDEKIHRLREEEDALFQKIIKLVPTWTWSRYFSGDNPPARKYVEKEGHNIRHCRLCSSIINKLEINCWEVSTYIYNFTPRIEFLQQEYELIQMEKKAKFEKVVIPDLDKVYGILGNEFEKYTNELPNIRIISSTWTTPAHDEQPILRSCDTKKPSYELDSSLIPKDYCNDGFYSRNSINFGGKLRSKLNTCVAFKHEFSFTFPNCCDKVYNKTQYYLAFGMDGLQNIIGSNTSTHSVDEISRREFCNFFMLNKYSLVHTRCFEHSYINFIKETLSMELVGAELRLTNQLVRKVNFNGNPEEVTNFAKTGLTTVPAIVGAQKDLSSHTGLVTQVIKDSKVVMQIFTADYIANDNHHKECWKKNTTFFIPRFDFFAKGTPEYKAHFAPHMWTLALCNQRWATTGLPYLPSEILKYIYDVLPEMCETVDRRSPMNEYHIHFMTYFNECNPEPLKPHFGFNL